MSKSPARVAKTTPSNGNAQVQFINYELPDDERKMFKAWASAKDFDLLALLEKLVDDGYGFSAKFDDFSDCVAAFIQVKKADNPNFGWILTGRGSSVFSALTGALYRHYVLFEGHWPVEQNRRGKLDDD